MQEELTLKTVCQLQKGEHDKINNLVNKYDVTFSKNGQFMSKVYVNPYYTAENTKIYLNPYAKNKPSIHVNPKLLTQNFSQYYNQEQSTKITNYHDQDVDQDTFEGKTLVYVNRKLMSKLVNEVSDDYNINQQNNCTSSNLETTSLSSNIFMHHCKPCSKCRTDLIEISTEKKIDINNSTHITKSHLSDSSHSYLVSKYLAGTDQKFIQSDSNIQKHNSILDILSDKKFQTVMRSSHLVGRANLMTTKRPLYSPHLENACNTFTVCKLTSKRSAMSTLLKEKQASLSLKKFKCDPAKMHLWQRYNVTLIKTSGRCNINWQNNINKSISVKPQKHITSKMTTISSCGLVSIGGIMYKKSRNQLVRQGLNLHVQREQNFSSKTNNEYSVTKSNDNKSVLNSSQAKLNILSKNHLVAVANKNFKTNASNKAKQKSLQILRNKMHKTNQPCLLFQKFGYCANEINDACLKVHDKNQVVLCKNFLQGKCLSNDCLLSHNIGPEKMPTCKYFLEGCCTRDRCPYLHVKVSSKSPICIEFLRGYCSQGHDCQKRHIYTCPEYEKSSRCSKYEFCPYPHKRWTAETKISKKYVNPMSNGNRKYLSESKDAEIPFFEYRKRYYEDAKENLSEKEEGLFTSVNTKTDINAEQWNQSNEKMSDKFLNTNKYFENSLQCSSNSEKLYNKVERHLIGPLPSYIPIDE